METLTISRIIFLLFIVVLSVYFFYLNKNFATKEHFTDTKQLSSDEVASITRKVYETEFKRGPDEKELMFFQAVNLEKSPTRDELISMIKSGADLLEKSKSIYDTRVMGESVLLKDAYGTEDEVTEIFNVILLRLPSDEELLNFSRLLKEDKTFTLEKLKQLLYGSEEYERLEKTQSNQVYSNLLGGVTDRQLILLVTSNYKTITGKDLIDADEIHFLKKKLLEFNLDEPVFQKFLKNYITNQPFNQQLAASQKANSFIKETVNQEQKANTTQQEQDKLKKELFDAVMKDIKTQSLVNQEQPSFKEHCQVEQPNKQVIEVLLKTSGDSSRTDNYLDSSDVLDTIKKQAKCVFNKDVYKEDSQSMAALIAKRNKETLGDTCVRNKTYLGLDEDMVLDPSLRWSVPQRYPPVCVGGKNDYQPQNDQTALIGTLLENAKNTKVGSVVEFYPPK
jgi:hypothetical protein